MTQIEKKEAAGLTYYEKKGDPQGATIILFHGYGSSPDDLFSLTSLSEGEPKVNWIFPEGPERVVFSHDYTGCSWFNIRLSSFEEIESAFPPNLIEIREKVIDFIAALKIPLSKLFLGGFSQGAVLACEVAFHLPEKIGGLLLFSGTLINKFEWVKAAPSQRGAPFFLSHGMSDPILPYTSAEHLETLLIEAGLKGKLHSFRGSHEIPHAILNGARQFLTHLSSAKSD